MLLQTLDDDSKFYHIFLNPTKRPIYCADYNGIQIWLDEFLTIIGASIWMCSTAVHRISTIRLLLEDITAHDEKLVLNPTSTKLYGLTKIEAEIYEEALKKVLNDERKVHDGSS